MRRNILNNIMLVSLLTLAGCSNETDIVSTQSTDKTPISLSVGVESANTRAVTTDGTGKTLVALPENTNIWMAMKSEKAAASPMYCSTIGTTKDASDNENPIEFASDNTRFWDDAYGKDANLSVWALTVPGVETAIDGKSATLWNTTTPDASTYQVSWSLSSAQTSETVANEDLCFSNNIAADKMIFGGKVSNKFDQGKLIFYHALSKVTFKFVPGDGFKGDGTDFKFDGSSTDAYAPISVKGFKLTGTFDVVNGEFSSQATSATEITSMGKTTPDVGNENGYTLEALVMPGRDFAEDASTDAVSFSIDGNPYKVSAATLMTKLRAGISNGEWTTMEAGKNYVFTFKISKTGIVVSATLADWNDVEAEKIEKNNSHFTFSFYNNTKACTDINLYKYEQGLTDIVTSADYSATPVAGIGYTEVTLVGSASPYKTNEYYKDNKTAYHFRSLNNAAETALNAGKTAFKMTSGSTDYHWGAPMLPTNLTSIPYSSETGYSLSIAKGIVAASKESNIVLTEIHMMSQIAVKLTTPDDGSGINLSNAEIYLTKYKATGEVDMSLGKITLTNDITDKSDAFPAAPSPATNTYVFNVVPQDLVRSGSEYIGITIIVDGNEYNITNLSDITGTAGSEVTNMQTADKITTWYPGHKYKYTFNLKKKQIEVITATIVPWNEVAGTSTDLDIENY